jgi:C-terminal processing protease CtpA/Prc
VTGSFSLIFFIVFSFFYYAGKLAFSHYALMKIRQEYNETPTKNNNVKYVFLEEQSAETAYLKITSFGGSASEMDSIFDVINQKNYKNLVVDLRNNSGGSVEAGIAFASGIVDDTIYAGVLLTQKWFNNNKQLPVTEEYRSFPHFSEANFDLIIEGIHHMEGLCLKIIPKKEVYKGRIYILTNHKTASTCEPIIYQLKKQKRATIVGEKTAGAMLNGEIFDLDKGFNMVIPTADYYTSDGFRIDQNGVMPDIEVKSGEALKFVLEKLKY